MTLRRALRVAGLAALVAAIVVYSLFPFYWAIVSSFEFGSALFTVDVLPRDPSFDNYVAVFRAQPLGRNILNSVVVATSVVALSLLVAIGASYALGRVDLRGRRLLLLLVLGVSAFPQIAVLTGMFELIRAFGLYNRLLGLCLAYLIFTVPFSTWVLTIAMRELPRDVEEAAIVDGASPSTVLARILVPMLWPSLATTALLAFIVAWNEFLFALTFTLSNDARTVPVAIALMSGSSEYELPWGQVMAASVVVTLPLVIVALVFQRRIVSGLTAGAVKG